MIFFYSLHSPVGVQQIKKDKNNNIFILFLISLSLLPKKVPQVMTTRALGKRSKSKVNLNKDFCATRKGPQVESKLNKDFW